MLDIKDLRPKHLDGVIGNTYTIELLTKALQNNNFPSFSILAGPEGIGKTTLSKIFAKHLTCENPQNGFACEKCGSCNNANNLVIGQNKDSINIMTFRMSDEGGKRPARKIQEQIQSLPQFSKYKVIILEELQGISREAQDLLLPILEYIPQDTKIIACTTDLKFLQKTFLSRAHVLKMVTPSKELIENLLIDICTKRGIKVVGKLPITRIIENCEFKPRHSINELIKLTKYSDEIDMKVVAKFLDLVNEDYYLEYLELLRGDMGGIIDFTNKLQSNEVSLIDFVKGLNGFIIKLITFRYRAITLPESVMLRSKKLLTGFEEDQFLKVQSIVADEVPKFTLEEYSKAQLISLSFKLMNKNNEALVETEIKSSVQVMKEKELALKNQIEYNRQKETQNQIESVSGSDNAELMLLNTEAKVLKFGGPVKELSQNPEVKDGEIKVVPDIITKEEYLETNPKIAEVNITSGEENLFSFESPLTGVETRGIDLKNKLEEDIQKNGINGLSNISSTPLNIPNFNLGIEFKSFNKNDDESDIKLNL